MVAHAVGRTPQSPAPAQEASSPPAASAAAPHPTSGTPPAATEPRTGERAPARILVVDDDPLVLRSVRRLLEARGHEVHTASNGKEAVSRVDKEQFDTILSDIAMPGMDGIELLRQIRQHDLLVPVVLITGEPAVNTAVMAIEYGAHHYLTKPVSNDEMAKVVEKAVQLHRVARLKQQAAELLGNAGAQATDRAGLEASFDRFMQSFWMAYHPIVDAVGRKVFGYEALLRSKEPSLPHPGAVLDAAERLGAIEQLGRAIRARTAQEVGDATHDAMTFVNLHVTDLLDPTLLSPDAQLSKLASRVVLEITERASLDEVKDAKKRIAVLREIGFQIAVDDMGAGYAGLTSFALLEPEFVKLDMSLIRGVDTSSTKQKVIRSMTSLSRDMGMRVVAEGVETVEESQTLIELGCDLLQGFLYAKPAWPFPEPVWP